MKFFVIALAVISFSACSQTAGEGFNPNRILASSSSSTTSINAIATQSINEDSSALVSVVINKGPATSACTGANLSMTSSNAALVLNTAVVWGGVYPNCTATISPIANAYGSTTITIAFKTTTTRSFTLNVAQVGDEASTLSIPFDSGTDASYTFNSSKIELTSNGMARLKTSAAFSDSSNIAAGFAGGSLLGLTWDGALSGMKMSTAENYYSISSDRYPQYANVVLHYSFEGTTGNVANGTIITASVGTNGTAVSNNDATMQIVSSGKVGKCFSNSAQRIEVTDNALNLTTNFSVAFWIKKTAGSTGMIYQSYDQISPWAGFGIYAPAGDIQFWNSTAWTSSWTGGQTILDGVWHHYAITFNGTDYNTYLDGVNVRTVTASAPSSFVGTRAVAGTVNGGLPMDATLDEFTVWNTPLTGAEIYNLYTMQLKSSAGVFTSRIFDAGSATAWNSLRWVNANANGKELLGKASAVELPEDYSSSTTTVNSGLQGLWHFNESGGAAVTDSTDNNNDGVAGGGVTLGSSGKFGNSATFSNSNITIPTSTLTSYDHTQPISIAGWFYVTGIAGFTSFVASEINAITFHGFRFGLMSDGKLMFIMCNDYSVSNYMHLYATSYIPPLNTWVHLAVTYDGSSATGGIKLYANGAEITAVTVGANNLSATVATAGDLMIGNSHATLPYYGKIDELGFWNRNLTAAEIKELYNRGASNLQLQVRSCDDAACAGETWTGPDNTVQTYFSELYNNSDPATLTGDVFYTNPLMRFSLFSSLNILTNRYFQYRAIFTGDDSSVGVNELPILKKVDLNSTVDSSDASIVYNTTLGYFNLASFTETSGFSCLGTIRHMLSNDSGTTWYYYNTGSSAWATSDGTFAKASDASTINANLASFNSAHPSGTLKVKSVLHSNGYQPCDISALSVGGLQ